MPSTRDYHQTATYWAAPVEDGYGGKTFDSPRLLEVRWESRQENFSDFAGDVHVSRAVVFVKEDVDIGGYLELGDSTLVADPNTLETTFAIRQLAKIPDIRNASYERRAFL